MLNRPVSVKSSLSTLTIKFWTKLNFNSHVVKKKNPKSIIIIANNRNFPDDIFFRYFLGIINIRETYMKIPKAAVVHFVCILIANVININIVIIIRYPYWSFHFL